MTRIASAVAHPAPPCRRVIASHALNFAGATNLPA